MTRNNVCGWKGAQLGVLGALSMVVAARAQAAGDDDVTNDGVFTTIILASSNSGGDYSRWLESLPLSISA